MDEVTAELAGFKKRLFALIDDKFHGAHTGLARAAGIPPTTIQGWKDKDKFIPNALYVNRIAKACGVTVDWLLTGEDPGTQHAQTQATEESDTVHELIEEIGSLPSKEYWELFYQVTSDPTWEGWYKIELIRRFPEIAERIKKRMDLGDEAALERPQAVGEK